MWIPFVIGGAVFIGVIVLNIGIVAYYGNVKRRSLLPSLTTVASLTVALVSLLIIPIDIYSVSNKNYRSDVKLHAAIRAIYALLYGIIILLCFIAVPFSYFFYEKHDPENPRARIKRAFLYTIIFIAILIVLILVGLFLRNPSVFKGKDKPSEWAQNLVGEGGFIGALSFFIGCVTVCGYLIWISYTAYGMSNLPLTLIKGAKSFEQEKKEIGKKIEKNQKKLSKQKDPRKAENENRKLEKRLHQVRLAHQGINRLKVLLRPFGIVFGVVFFAISLLITVSIFLTLIDRLVNHIGCGIACGFILSHSGIFNPLDRLLVLLSHAFPLDFILLLVIILYLYLATLNGIVYWGIRLCCIKLYSFREARTPPQGLLIGSVFLMINLLAIENQILTIAPSYAMFGSQRIMVDNVSTACGLNYVNSTDNIQDECVPTQIGGIINLISLKSPIFGLIFFGFACAFIILWVAGVFISIFRARDSTVEVFSSDEDVI
jgi:LMBR1 domain-containing protein 1